MSQLKTSAASEDDDSLSRRVYTELRARIIKGDFPPGARLRERELAEEFVVSRIPLREAIPQLEAEGFVTSLPRRGATVTQLTIRDVEELFEVRLGVEVFANRVAAGRVAAGASAESLHQAMARCDEALHGGDATEISETSSELHEEIIRVADNALLTSMLRAVTGRDRWIFQMTTGTDPVRACQEHHELVDAICAGNGDLAAALAYAHIENRRLPTLAALTDLLPAANGQRRASRLRVAAPSDKQQPAPGDKQQPSGDQ